MLEQAQASIAGARAVVSKALQVRYYRQVEAQVRKSKGAHRGFWLEIRQGLLAGPLIMIGLTMVQFAISGIAGEVFVWWQAIVGLLVGVIFGAIGLVLILKAIGPWMERMGGGWIGILTGQVPRDYKREGLSRGIGNLVVFAACVVLGLFLLRHGRLEHETKWSLQGLLLAMSGVVFGLLPAIPNFWFANGKRGVGSFEKGKSIAPWLIVATSLSLGVAWGTADLFRLAHAKKADPFLPYGEWLRIPIPDNSVGSSASEKPASEKPESFLTARISPRPRELLRVEAIDLGKSCKLVLRSADGKKLLSTKKGRNESTLFIEFRSEEEVEYRVSAQNCGDHFITLRYRKIRNEGER